MLSYFNFFSFKSFFIQLCGPNTTQLDVSLIQLDPIWTLLESTQHRLDLSQSEVDPTQLDLRWAPLDSTRGGSDSIWFKMGWTRLDLGGSNSTRPKRAQYDSVWFGFNLTQDMGPTWLDHKWDQFNLAQCEPYWPWHEPDPVQSKPNSIDLFDLSST